MADADKSEGLDPLALAALQSQIATLRELIDGLQKKLDGLATHDARVGVIERAAEILLAIVGELHTNATRSDVRDLVKQLRALLAPMLKEEGTREAA